MRLQPKLPTRGELTTGPVEIQNGKTLLNNLRSSELENIAEMKKFINTYELQN